MSVELQTSGVPIQQQQRQPVVLTSLQQDPNARRNYQKRLNGFAISEVVLGFLCMIIGAVIAGIVGSSPYSIFNRFRFTPAGLFTIGEGLWCGIWIVIAGILGILSARSNASRSTIIAHMALSIVGAAFSAVLFGLSVYAAIFTAFFGPIFIAEDTSIAVLALYSILSILSFACLVLLILSASYCCALTMYCCIRCCDGSGDCNCCMPYPSYQGQMTYVQQPGGSNPTPAYYQPPMYPGQGPVQVTNPGMGNVQPGYVVQGVQPTGQPVAPQVYPGGGTAPAPNDSNSKQTFVNPITMAQSDSTASQL